NQGVINANAGAGQNALYIQTSNGTTNTGTLEATNGSTLSLDGNTFTNTGGTIKAVGAGAGVNLQNGGTGAGGMRSSSGGGGMRSVTVERGRLNGVTNGGTYVVPNASTITLVGTVTNTGTMQINSAGNGTVVDISGNVILAGGGTVTMQNSSANFIQGASGK